MIKFNGFVMCDSPATTSDLLSLPTSDGSMRIYALLANGAVTYVGSTESLKERVFSHGATGKSFDAVAFGVCDKNERFNVESANIVKYKPALNKTLPTNSMFVSKSAATIMISDSLNGGHVFAPESGNPQSYFEKPLIDSIARLVAEKIKKDNEK